MDTSLEAVHSATIATFLSMVLAISSPAFALDVGDTAPDFELPSSNGQVYRLSDFRGKQAVVIAWFPQSFTSGCTIECKSLAQNGDTLREFDMKYFMASVDPIEESKRFAATMEADFPLLSDPSMETAREYGVLYQNRFALRQTFYIDVNGVIVAIDSNVNPATAASDMIDTLDELNVGRRRLGR